MVRAAKRELEEQGHVVTGKLVDSLRGELEVSIDRASFHFYSLTYGRDLDTGISPDQLEFAEHYAAILKWARAVRRGDSERMVRRFAYNTTKKHIKVGIPTAGSYKYSKNGRRTGWIKNSYGASVNEFLEILDLGLALNENLLDITLD